MVEKYTEKYGKKLVIGFKLAINRLIVLSVTSASRFNLFKNYGLKNVCSVFRFSVKI